VNRLVVLARADLRLQLRYGILAAAALVTAVWIVVLLALPSEARATAVPVVLFVELGVIGFYFVAALVLFERREGSLVALAVTPVRFGEYLGAKLATLTGLAVVCSVALVTAARGGGVRVGLLLLAVALMSVVCLLVAFIAVAPFDDLTRFMVVVQLPLAPFFLPLAGVVGWFDSPLFYASPVQAMLLSMQAAFGAMDGWKLLYAVAYRVALMPVLWRLARRGYRRRMIDGAGA
jgi:fluoroquinolone transport system permease protein